MKNNMQGRYNYKTFLDHLRKSSPKAYIQYLKDTKESGKVIIPYKDCDKLHKEIIVRDGIVHYWVYYRSGQIVNKGIEK